MDKTETRICQNCKSEFIVEPDDFDFYEKIQVPPPTWCPECREIRRLTFRNEHSLYKRKCDLCNKIVVSRVSPDRSYTVYCQKCWWSDKWDSLDYGRDYDFNKSFFEQFKELLLKTPHISLLNFNTVNSEWVNQESDVKNCYLEFGGHYNEDSAYNTYSLYGKDCFDNYWVLRCELCYECVYCERCFKTLFSQDCIDCRETILSYDCRNCEYILGCAGLRNKKYHLFNEAVSKEEYSTFLNKNPFSSHKVLMLLKTKAHQKWNSVPHRYRFVLKSNNVSGDRITESKNAHNVWSAEKAEDSKNLYITMGMKDSYDGSSVGWGELVYEGAHSGGLYNSKFFAYNFGGSSGVEAKNSTDIIYCYTTPQSKNCFGCANLKNQEYCILNKKYPKYEYEILTSKIKKQMLEIPYTDVVGRKYVYGEFFPVDISPFGYNETTAQDYYPLSQDEAKEKGFNWSEYESESKYELSNYEIPDKLEDVSDDILEKILKDEVTGQPYKVVPMELQFCRRLGLPIPRRSYQCRYKDRFKFILPRRFWHRKCMCSGITSDVGRPTSNIYQNTAQHFHGKEHCPNEFETSYAPERPEIVYCEQCYQQEVV